MTIVHLAASPFFGGPERQMLGLARNLPPSYRSVFLSFAEGGRSDPFLAQLRRHGVEAVALRKNYPRLLAATGEIVEHLRRVKADVLLCHGYKPDIVGYFAARRAGVSVVAVSRGWTSATARVRLNELIDRRIIHFMDRVVCVSQEQAKRVRRAGVRQSRIVVIHNSIQVVRFANPDRAFRRQLENFFPSPPKRIVIAAGRLSPDKGFADLIAAAQGIVRQDPGIGFVLFGDGPLRLQLARQIKEMNLEQRFVLAGFRDDLDHLIPHADLMTLPSYTEGMPNVVLEAHAAAVPVVATAAGGTPEIIRDGLTGYLVPAGDRPALARRILDCLGDEDRRKAMGQAGRDLIQREFTFAAQCAAYQKLFAELTHQRPSPIGDAPAETEEVRPI